MLSILCHNINLFREQLHIHRPTSTISNFSMPHFNHLKFFIDPLWPLNFFNKTTSTTSSILLTHYNHFKFFIDPLRPLQVFHWPTLSFSLTNINNFKSFIDPLQLLQVFQCPTSSFSLPHFDRFMFLSGHVPEIQAEVEVVKIKNPDFSCWAWSTPWGLVLSLKSFCRNPVLSWAIQLSFSACQIC